MKKIVKRTKISIHGTQNQYIDYADYYEGNYSFDGDGECYEYEDYENGIKQPKFYNQ